MKNSIKHILPAFDIDMGGLLLKQALPNRILDQIDPFLLLHHADFNTKKNSPALHQGVGPHPHRGFTPVTFVIQGEMHHRDSRGNNQIAKTGEVQWMHAGAGIVHSERPSEDIVDQSTKQEFIQLWINSPAKSKMKIPTYQYIAENDFPKVVSTDKLINYKIVAGNFEDKTGKISTESEMNIIWANAKSGGEQTFNINSDFNTTIFLISGSIKVDNEIEIGKQSLILFDKDALSFQLEILEEASFLLLEGKPLNEKVVQSGPFVMNSQTEIMEAMRDYQMGKMGVLIEE